MKKPAAVIDKSLLQAICEQVPANQIISEKALSDRYQVVIASVLVEELWVNLANPNGKASPVVVAGMKEFLIRQDGSWINDPLEIAFAELIDGKSIETLPSPKNLIFSFFLLPTHDPALVNWATKRAELTKLNISRRVKIQAEILSNEKYAAVKDGQEFFEKFIRQKFVEMLSDPSCKRKLLERELGLSFRANHPGRSVEIDQAFDAYSPETFDKYQATLMCIIASMFYFYAPLCKIVPIGANQPIKILGRGFGDQFNNLADERYVQSALLCDRLLTRDEGMHNIMQLLQDCGFWKGMSVFIDPKRDMAVQISKNLV